MRENALALLLVLSACGSDGEECVPGAAASPCKHVDPEARGPFPVGVTTLELIDESRKERDGSPRTLLVEFWYPAVDESSSKPRDIYNLLTEMPDDLKAQIDTSADYEFKEQDAARDVAPRRQDGPYPVLLFSHGKNGIRYQTFTLMTHLASHGYVVAAPDHSNDLIWDLLRSSSLVEGVVTSLVNRPQDLSFIASYLGDTEGLLAGVASIDKLAAFGHSFGGTTSMVIAAAEGEFRDPRFDAILPITPAAAVTDLVGAGPGLLARPMLMLAAKRDGTLDYETDQLWGYENANRPKALVAVEEAGHFSFTELCTIQTLAELGSSFDVNVNAVFEDGCGDSFIDPDLLRSIQNRYATAFFNAILRSDAQSLTALTPARIPDTLSEEIEVRNEGL